MQLSKRLCVLALALAVAILTAVPMPAHASEGDNVVYVDGLPSSDAILKGKTCTYTLDFPDSNESYFYMVVYSASPLTITTDSGTATQQWISGNYRCYKVPMYPLGGTRNISVSHSADFDLSVYYLSTFRYARHATISLSPSVMYYATSVDPTAVNATSGTTFTGFPLGVSSTTHYTNLYISSGAVDGMSEVSVPIRLANTGYNASITDVTVYSGGYPIETTVSSLEVAEQIYAEFEGVAEEGTLLSGQQFLVVSFKPRNNNTYCIQVRMNVGEQGSVLQFYRPTGYISPTPSENFIFHEILRNQQLSNELLAELVEVMQGDTQTSQDFGTDAQDKSNNLQSQVNQMGQLEKPDISHVDMSFNAHVNPSTLVTNVSPLTAILSDSKLISMVLMATIIALVSYVLFGRK